MTPAVPQVLADLAARVARNAAPQIPAAERAGELGLSALLLGLAAEMWDGAAERLVLENRGFRGLLAKGASVASTSALRQALETLASGGEASLRLSALQSANSSLRAGLIALQLDLEGRDDPPAKALEADVWRGLADAALRSRLSGSPV
ncbi:MAG: hypothetical protein MH112_04825 [Phenylobacterium sp.]|uniref:hypothetical protein n=1 Tax=Phenylobacterium sp. TaxID=1871053 RepID=UPI0025DB8C0A|nr:hypothetical protein [Phenylobacterium sp.]MCG9915671.1 hypothetical protein [Phenylobacterium sp.]